MPTNLLYNPRQFEALRPLEAEEAQRALLEAHRRVRAGSWYRSRLAWSMIGWAIVPMSAVAFIGAILPWTPPGKWLLIPVVAVALATVLGMNATIRRAYARAIDCALAEQTNRGH